MIFRLAHECQLETMIKTKADTVHYIYDSRFFFFLYLFDTFLFQTRVVLYSEKWI